MSYTVENGKIYAETGIPSSPRWFTDNRLSIQFDAIGVKRVEYRNPEQKDGNPIVFLKGLHDGFRYYIEHNGITKRAEYKNTTIWPFGIVSEWSYGNIILYHSVFTVGDLIVIKLTTPNNMPSGIKFKLEFNEAFSFIPSEQNNFLYSEMGAKRIWDKWEYNDIQKVLKGKYIERLKESRGIDENDLKINDIETSDKGVEAALSIYIGADFELEYDKRCSKHILYSPELESNNEYNFITAFIAGKDDRVEYYRKKVSLLGKNIKNLFKRYNDIINTSPKLESPYEKLNDFISLSPLYHESLKATEYPGAIKAKTSNYWVWGWDGLTSNCASLYWGDTAFIRDMLDLYEKTAHPEKGIAHSYRNDMEVGSISALTSQGMYITLLQHYYNFTSDLETIKKHYEFAKKIYKRILELEVKGTGFCEGISLFPDFPIFMKETGHDISAFNNTIFYCASRSMEYLAVLLGDSELSNAAKMVFKKMEKNFSRLFYDEEKEFIVNSVDSETLQKRKCYSSDAVKWENEYCNDLLDSFSEKSMKFFENHFVSKAGIRPMPIWDSAFDGDANQLHSWWPVMTEYYMKLVNGNNRRDLIEKWINWVEYWTEKLTIPEGIPCYIDTDEPEQDKWDTLCGTWQAYSVRGWYQAIIHGVVGMGIDAGGITFYPYEGEELKMKGLHYGNRIVDIEMYGSGRYIDSININGVSIRGTNKLPKDLINNKNIIKVYRVKENTYVAHIKTLNGIELSEYIYDKKGIKAKLSGHGTSRIKIQTEKKLSVKINSEKVCIMYCEELKMATIDVNIFSGEIKELDIVF